MYTKTSFVALAKFSANVCWALAEQKRALQSERRTWLYHPIYSTRTAHSEIPIICLPLLKHVDFQYSLNTARARIIYMRKREQLRLQMCILKSNCVGECGATQTQIHTPTYIYTYIYIQYIKAMKIIKEIPLLLWFALAYTGVCVCVFFYIYTKSILYDFIFYYIRLNSHIYIYGHICKASTTNSPFK